MNKAVKKIGVVPLLMAFPIPVSFTWGIVLFETILEAAIPLFIGFSIDGVLQKDYLFLHITACIFFMLIVISVMRRVYDTRVYGHLKVILGQNVHDSHSSENISVLNARLNMSRELVDFLESHFPQIVASVVQIIVSLIILYSFDHVLAYLAVATLILIIVIYSGFHKSFYRLNHNLNEQQEQQISNLGNRQAISSYLKSLKNIEIKLSDREAVLYGLIFMCLGLLLMANLLRAASMDAATAGSIFSVVVYTWEYIEAIILLPVVLQLCTRLKEIEDRLNKQEGDCHAY